MNETPETPDSEPADDLAHEQNSAGEATDFALETEDEESNNLSFALLAIALLVMVGASVYFVGTLLNNGETTSAAEESADQQIETFGTTPITLAPDETPSELPLQEPTETTEAPEPQQQQDEEPDPSEAAFPNVDPANIGIVFVNRAAGPDYGKVGYIDRTGERNLTELECSRIDVNANGGLCLDEANGIGGGGRGLILDANLNPSGRFGINLPSRAAISPDGDVVAWTGFSVGHSYLAAGEFATTTQLIEVDRRIGANLETAFALFDADGEAINDETRNFWGVSFVDSDRFYATVGIGPETSIIEGNVSNSRLQVVHENATCPEVSPDGSTIVAKERRGDSFQVIAIDTATGARRDLGESRSVEDQVEFLDNSTIIYGLPNTTEGTEAQPAWDVWALDINGGSPQLIIPFADSPAAV